MGGRGVTRAVDELHAHLVATEELPVDPAASPLLGEAAAVAADVAEADDPPEAVVVERVRRVVDLFAELDGTGNPEADERVTAAERVARDLLQERS
jgi:hypothetical protein